jgi:hypothetical protein
VTGNDPAIMIATPSRRAVVAAPANVTFTVKP